jgi:hypothetical protein
MTEAVTDQNTLTVDEAYSAMALFLDAYWKRGGEHAEELAILLGGMSLLSDGRPADAAMWTDWEAAVVAAREGQRVDLVLKR